MSALDGNNNILRARDPQIASCFWCLEANPSLMMCLKCGEEIYFCSPDHLKYHLSPDDGQDGPCLPFQIDYAPPVGRFMTATKDIEPGGLIFQELPLVVGPTSQIEGLVCVECFCRCDGSVRCVHCNFPLCSIICPRQRPQRWHQTLECPVLQGQGFRAPDPTFSGIDEKSKTKDDMNGTLRLLTASLLPLRLILLEELENSKSTSSMLVSPMGPLPASSSASTSPRRGPFTFHGDAKDELVPPRRASNGYENGNESGSLSPVVDQAKPSILLDLHERMTRVIQEEFKLGYNEVEIWNCVGKMLTNAKSLEGAGFGSGSGLFERYAMINHSCIPNTKCTINPKNYCLELRARTFIHKGTEITTRYVSFNIGLPDKQVALEGRWHFQCICVRCQDPTELNSFVSALRCEPSLKCGSSNGPPHCDSYLVPMDLGSFWSCLSCQKVLARKKIIKRLGNHSKIIGQTMQQSTRPKYLISLLDELCSDLHPNHYLILEVRYLLMLSLAKEDSSRANCSTLVEITQDLLAITSILDPGPTKTRGIILKHLIPAWRRLAQMELDMKLIPDETFRQRKEMSHKFAKDLISCYK
ncbi:hypothetical protein TCAL_05703 [Tigriopus californicus]|uniref:SET domain-containing protein n=1 Tax=Tigriopus californicus TaxID=6832 RepID=A0A553N854_TIGCA|nr:uncharacterized protein LOC131885097 [Tigriopus californicus]TRY61608.1 hypothetical protein TCAL_05703 [Tigriopus californicus]